MSSCSVTKGELVMLHLNKFRHVPYEKYGMPYGMTQDGIAVALGISRAHASIELKKLVEKNRVEIRGAHIRTGKRVLNVYSLTNEGLEKISDIEIKAEENGIDLESLFAQDAKKNRNGERPRLRMAEKQIMDALEILEEIRGDRNRQKITLIKAIHKLTSAINLLVSEQEVI